MPINVKKQRTFHHRFCIYQYTCSTGKIAQIASAGGTGDIVKKAHGNQCLHGRMPANSPKHAVVSRFA